MKLNSACPAVESTSLSILGRGKSSFEQALFRSCSICFFRPLVPEFFFNRLVSLSDIQPMDHKMGIYTGHFVDGISKDVLKLTNDFDNLGPYVARNLLADLNCPTFPLVDAYFLITVCRSRPLVPFGIFSHVEPYDRERVLRLRVLSAFLGNFLLILVLENVDITFLGGLQVPE